MTRLRLIKMRLRVFFLVCALGGLASSIITRVADWSDETSFLISMLGMVVLMLICFPFLDPSKELGRGPGRR